MDKRKIIILEGDKDIMMDLTFFILQQIKILQNFHVIFSNFDYGMGMG